MKAALLEKPYQFVIKEIAEPKIKKSWVKIKVKSVGVCGSELHAFQGKHPFRIPPIISGHEVGGEIVELGEGVKEFEVGDRVTVEPQYSCGECIYCRTGNHNLCKEKVVMGTETVDWSFCRIYYSS